MSAIHLVRHGQASFGAVDYDLLSAAGEQQAVLVGRAMGSRHPRPDLLLSGTLCRQRRTAVLMAEAAGWGVPVGEDPAWDEYDHLGLLRAQGGEPSTDPRRFQAQLEATLAAWADATSHEGETFEQFRSRVVGGLTDVADRLGSGESAVVVTSGGVISLVVATLLSAGTTSWLRLNRVCVNSGVTTVVTGRSGMSVVSFNDHGHLPADALTYR